MALVFIYLYLEILPALLLKLKNHDFFSVQNGK